MDELPDETLMAYADGELQGVEREKVRAYVSANPDAARRVAEFAQTREGLGRLLNPALLDPVPARLLETVMPSAGRSPERNGPPGRPATRWRTFTSQLADLFGTWPMTASAALAAGALAFIAIGSQLASLGRQHSSAGVALVALEGGHAVATGRLAQALDTAPSGTSVGLTSSAGPAILKPVLSFETKAGGYCRQYALQQDSGSLQALSCRTPSGRWTVEAMAPLASAGAPGHVNIAGADSAQAVDEVVTRLIKGDPFGSDREQSLIAHSWSETSKP